MYCIEHGIIQKQSTNNLSLENEVRADLVGRAGGCGLIQTLCVERNTEAGLDTGAESLGVACKRRSSALEARAYSEPDAPRPRIPALLILALTKAALSR